MPVSTVRQRRASAAEPKFATADECYDGIRAAHGDAERWRLVRPRVIRWLLMHGAGIKDSDSAAKIADAFFRCPNLVPPRGPK